VSHYWCSAWRCRVNCQAIARNREALCVVALAVLWNCQTVYTVISTGGTYVVPSDNASGKVCYDAFCMACYVGSGLGYA